MSEPHSQSTYQVRLGWGVAALARLADSDIVIIVDAIGDDPDLARQAVALPHGSSVYRASLRNATATARAVRDEQLARSARTSINLVLAGDEGAFAVEDYLAAGAVADALDAFGIDHSSPDAAVATEGFRPLTRALKHLLSASAAGQQLRAAGRADEVREASALDADDEATRLS